ncbi:MAG: serine hydrolase [Planctomycetota bacterium]
MTARLILPLATLAAVLCGCVTNSVSAQDSMREKVLALAEPYVDSKTVDALSIGVIKGEQTATVHLGKLDDGLGAPNDDTIYEIGSVSKVFTGILLADAVERGTMKLDQPAKDYGPEGASMPSRGDKQITLKQLSTHRSGLPRMPTNFNPADNDNPFADYDSKKAIEFLASYELPRDPGESTEYSNLAVSWLGFLISNQAGKSYDSLMKERITGPLGMKDTSVALDDMMKKRFAPGHTAGFESCGGWDFADMPGAGGIRSNVTDMLTFAKANLDPPTSELGKALELAWQKHEDAGDKPGEFAMGLGWHLALDGSTRWHNGQTGGFHSMLMVNRDLDAAVVILCNTAQMEVDQLAGDLIRSLAGAPVKPREFKKEAKVSQEIMEKYVGKYQLVPGVQFDVKIERERLLVKLTGQSFLEVFPKSDDVWFYKVVDAEITFNKGDDGSVESLTLFQNGLKQTAKRVSAK